MDSTELEQFFATTWASTVKKYKNTLDEDDQETVDVFKTWNELEKWLLKHAPSTIMMIRPSLNHLNVFSKFVMKNLAPSVDTTYLWGSLACLLQLVSMNLKDLEHVPRMIKSLAFKAEAFNSYYSRGYGASNVVNEVCFDMQLQFVGFFTTSIKHIHGTDLKGDRQTNQEAIQRRYEMATLEISEALSRLDKLLVVENHTEKRPTMEMPSRELAAKEHCLMLPITKTNRIFDRVDIFVKLDELLAPSAGEFSLQSVALHGIGGVGKSSIASSYAEQRFSEKAYNAILWVEGETEAALRQGFTNIALRLKLLGAQTKSHDENRLLVHDWFQSTESKWLVIFDNVESSETLRTYWPRSSNRGRAIITTRNLSLAFDPAASGLEVKHWDIDMGAEYLLFLLKKAVGRDLASESASARTLSEKLSGHALAISQMAGLIFDGEYSIKDFTTMYLENPRQTHASIDEFATLWDFAFRSLDGNSSSILGILSFLVSDKIQPEILQPPADQILPPDLGFLRDKFRGFSAAMRKLTTRALIKRDKDTGILTVHRLIQTQFRLFLSPEKRQKAFNDTVALVSMVLPKSDVEKGQLYDTWDEYNRYLQHVLRLRDIFEEERKASHSFTAPQKFCEILNDYQRFLYEDFAFEECERTCGINRDAASTLASDNVRTNLQGSIISHQAQVLEKLGEPEKAALVCQQEIDMRLGESPKKQILLAYSSCNLGIIYSSANDFEKALDAFRQSRRWWKAHFNSKGEPQELAPSIVVSEIRCMIGLGSFDAAEKMLQATIMEVKEEKPLNFGTLAYAYFCFGVLDRARGRHEEAEARFMESQNAWLKGGQVRKHPFNAGILYNMGACCLDQGKIEASIKHLRDSLEVTELHERTLPVENGRNYFKLSEALVQNGDDSAAEAEIMSSKAESCLRRKKPGVREVGTESSYNDLIPVYWR